MFFDIAGTAASAAEPDNEVELKVKVVGRLADAGADAALAAAKSKGLTNLNG